MKKIILLLALTYTLLSCLSNFNLTIKNPSELTGKTFVVTNLRKNDFRIIPFGIPGPRFEHKYNIVRPTLEIRNQLVHILKNKYKLKEKPNKNHSAPKIWHISQLAKYFPYADYILDVDETFVGTADVALSLTKHFVHYGIIFRLIEIKSNKSVAKGVCSGVPVSKKNKYAFWQLVTNNAALVKKELKINGNYCLNKLKKYL